MSRRPRTSFNGARQVWLVLAVLALAMRVAVPGGFMMGRAPSGAFAMVICSADGSQVGSAAWADADGRNKAPGEAQTHDAPCVFAGHALADAPPLPPRESSPSLVVAGASPALVRLVAPGRGLAAPPPPSTGPPAAVI